MELMRRQRALIALVVVVGFVVVGYLLTGTLDNAPVAIAPGLGDLP